MTILGFFLSVENIIPISVAIILFLYYYRLKLVDYLLFGFVFFFSFWSEFFTFLAEQSDVLVYYQGTYIMVTMTYIALLIHIHRINFQDLKSVRFAVEMIWALIIISTILSWKLMIQPETAKFFGISISRGSSIYFPLGAGRYFFGDNLLISTAHANVIYIFWAYVNGKAVYTYATMKLPLDNSITRRVKWLWTTAFGFSFLWTLSVISFFYVGTFTNNFVLVTYLLEIFIALRYNEAVLLTYTQITRAGNILNRSYQQLNLDEANTELQDYKVNLAEISAVITNLSYPVAQKLFADESENPLALFVLNGTQLIETFPLIDDFEDKYLVGNLISAIFSFSDEIQSKGRRSHYYRFQSENFNMIASTIDTVIICYIFTGFAPLAEIRLHEFMKTQEMQPEIWEGLRHEIPFMTNEDRQNLLTSINTVFT